MAMSKSDVRRAFRVVMAEDFADIPPAEEICHVFSADFLAKMEQLVAAEKRGSWKLLPRRRRRGLIVAAILAAALLLTACSPTVRQAVTKFVVSIYERGAAVKIEIEPRGELETIYVLDPALADFTLVSQEQGSPYFAETRYEDEQGTLLALRQSSYQYHWDTLRAGEDEVQVIGEGQDRVVFRCSEGLSSITWIYDGHYMNINYWGYMDSEQLLALTRLLVPVETGQESG